MGLEISRDFKGNSQPILNIKVSLLIIGGGTSQPVETVV